MSSPLIWKVYNSTEQTGSVRYAEEAAALVCLAGEGGRVEVDGRIVWREGKEAHHAGESYDFAAAVMFERRRQHANERYQRVMGRVVDASLASRTS